jgi:ABC-type uncharacterized transport system substrate-binding protein
LSLLSAALAFTVGTSRLALQSEDRMGWIDRLRAGWALISMVLATPAFAHPHVWVTARADVIFAPGGKLSGVRHSWSFDKGYSAFVTQGLDKNRDGKLTPDELQDLAKQNIESLAESEYFTVLKVNDTKQAFDAPRDYQMAVANDEATLTFFLPTKVPPPAAKVFAVEISDPTYFVAFSIAEGHDAMKLAGAPKGCSVSITRPKPMNVAQQQRNLSEAFFQALTSASNYGSQFANRAIIACP